MTGGRTRRRLRRLFRLRQLFRLRTRPVCSYLAASAGPRRAEMHPLSAARCFSFLIRASVRRRRSVPSRSIPFPDGYLNGKPRKTGRCLSDARKCARMQKRAYRRFGSASRPAQKTRARQNGRFCTSAVKAPVPVKSEFLQCVSSHIQAQGFWP